MCYLIKLLVQHFETTDLKQMRKNAALIVFFSESMFPKVFQVAAIKAKKYHTLFQERHLKQGCPTYFDIFVTTI